MDIEFGTDGWRTTREEFTDPRIRAVGQAVADYLRASDHSDPVAVGYDPREGSRNAAEELCRVLCANGFDALLPDRDTPTPVVAWTVRDRDLAGALQVTASHNPASYNGIKFIPEGGAPALPDVTDRLAENLREPDPLPEAEWGSVTETDFLDAYLDHALDFVEADLSGLTLAHDAMHGSGRGVTDELLARAGADVIRLRSERDPEFGGGSPEPSAARLRDLESRVQDGEAELGVANDGDSDRIAVVTPERGVVDANWLFVALYDSLLEEDILEGDAVRTVSTTYLVDRVASAHGHDVHETPVGFKWVAEAMADHDALIGGEESGGFGVRGHLRNKDGVLVALLVAAAHSEEPLDDRLDRLRDAYGDIAQDRISVDCPDDRKAAVIDSLDGSLPDRVAGVEIESVNDTDGFKLVLEDGSWLLVRPSGTEPKLRVYAEAESRERVEELLEAGRELVRPLI
ncbi:phosphoglucomutase/phosphomannomutase family protein [Natronomonas halophila]|uniref:phosphoglucomutase/phosphomannomutase family protein n=1 Tax=Natronomonas halophila TaxID=2747817 RepID=UPI0015B58C7B|nr:phosphoglucomutase/phosphomannomutase family protein [Natronomonas halophila]QLD86238.1 phosphoglucomutase/phosphomannomutase family protein [Natronomonas halophila]